MKRIVLGFVLLVVLAFVGGLAWWTLRGGSSTSGAPGAETGAEHAPRTESTPLVAPPVVNVELEAAAERDADARAQAAPPASDAPAARRPFAPSADGPESAR
ncbi:MAG: hypothetical protein HZA53_01905, partial [Planctomycetes bacterium]|nr:hypothetical protein [Planctomycetota bacterium]